MPHIRPFRPGDESALARICLLTADNGADATGVLADDSIWAEIFVLPYVARHPEFAFVVVDENNTPVGYSVAAPDTREFEDWFAQEWWPQFADRWPHPPAENSRQDRILRFAYARRGGAEPYGDEGYPAHLHIDLLAELQGQGFGRKLITTVSTALRDAGVAGLHLVASAANTGALVFYDRIGFTRLPSDDGAQAFGILL